MTHQNPSSKRWQWQRDEVTHEIHQQPFLRDSSGRRLIRPARLWLTRKHSYQFHMTHKHDCSSGRPNGYSCARCHDEYAMSVSYDAHAGIDKEYCNQCSSEEHLGLYSGTWSTTDKVPDLLLIQEETRNIAKPQPATFTLNPQPFIEEYLQNYRICWRMLTDDIHLTNSHLPKTHHIVRRTREEQTFSTFYYSKLDIFV
jgi:hypothetical protein